MKDIGYEIALNTEYDGYQTGVGTMLYKFLNKKTGCAATTKVAADVIEVPLQELYKTVIKNFKRSKGHPRFKNNIWTIKIIAGSGIGCITTLLLFILILLYLRGRYNRLVQEVKDEVVPLK